MTSTASCWLRLLRPFFFLSPRKPAEAPTKQQRYKTQYSCTDVNSGLFSGVCSLVKFKVKYLHICHFHFSIWAEVGSQPTCSWILEVSYFICQLILNHVFFPPPLSPRYGFSNMRYIASLISGVGIFMMGAGLSWYHGIMGLLHPQPIESLLWVSVCVDSCLWMIPNKWHQWLITWYYHITGLLYPRRLFGFWRR